VPGDVDEEVPPQPVNTRQEKRQRTTTASTQQPTRLMGLGSFLLGVCGEFQQAYHVCVR
jgi:hypothetical protein